MSGKPVPAARRESRPRRTLRTSGEPCEASADSDEIGQSVRHGEARFRAMLMQNFEYSSSDPERAHEMYHDDAVLEFPQSGKRFVGVENFREWRSNYPASTSFEIRELRGREDLWVVEVSVRYDQGPGTSGSASTSFAGTGSLARDLLRRGLGSTRVAGAVEGLGEPHSTGSRKPDSTSAAPEMRAVVQTPTGGQRRPTEPRTATQLVRCRLARQIR